MRSKQRVQHDFEHVIGHSRQIRLQELVRFLEARICVCFDESRLKVLISLPRVLGSRRDHHEVIADQLKGMLTELQFASDCLVGVDDLTFHLAVEGLLDLFGGLPSVVLIVAQLLTERVHTHDVAFIVLTIVLRILLHCVVR